MVEALGWAAFIVGLVGTLLLMSERGYRDGMRAAWFLASLAVPWWFTVSFRSVGLDAVTGVAVATLFATFARPFHGRKTHWVLADILLGAIVLTAVFSDGHNGTLIPGTILDLVRLWVFPYLLGRLCLDSWEDMSRTLPLLVVVVSVLSVFALVEAISHTNLLAKLSDKTWTLLDRAEGYRWGLKRAQGTTNHPIYFGLLLTLTLPWMLHAGRESLAGRAPRWWIAAPILTIAGAFATVSRSAHIAIIVVIAADLFFRRPNYRLPMFLILIIGGACFLVFREEILDRTGAYAGESDVGEERVKIFGVEYDYTGTRHRDLLLLAYEPAINDAGWFGYGTNLRENQRMKDKLDNYMDKRFEVSIDHHYLVHFLRYGYLGTAIFIAFGLMAAWNLGREAFARAGPLSDLAAGLFGAFVAVAVLVQGVAMAFDFGATWLFVAGLAASMSARRKARLAATYAPTNMTAVTSGEDPRLSTARSGN